MNENEKWKLSKSFLYLILGGVFAFMTIVFLYSLSVVASRGQKTMMGDPTGMTQLLLAISAIISIVFFALAINNIVTRKTPTKKKKLSLEKKELQDRLKKIEDKLDDSKEQDEEKDK